MAGLVEVGGGVLMRAGVTAPDVPAGEAHAQVRPHVVTVLRTLAAAPGVNGAGSAASEASDRCSQVWGGEFTSRCRVLLRMLFKDKRGLVVL